MCISYRSREKRGRRKKKKKKKTNNANGQSKKVFERAFCHQARRWENKWKLMKEADDLKMMQKRERERARKMNEPIKRNQKKNKIKSEATHEVCP